MDGHVRRASTLIDGACETRPMSDSITPFTIAVADEVLDDLRDRLARTRWPDQIPGAGWDYGAELSAVQDLCEYWRTTFDWRRAEALLNSWPQFQTDVDGINIHFIQARSQHEDAIPLCITHGWPGSIAEFMKILGPLTDPTAHGGDAADAFHVVAPSMPGYGFSGPTKVRGVDIRRVAAINTQLMARLGYDRYGAQGGDWGAIATAHMGQLDAEHLHGIHVNMAIPRAPKDDVMAGVQPDEMEGLAAMAHFRDHETGYQRIQGTKPQTLAYGLTDSPAGLAGWILEKFRTWSDCGGDVFSRFTRDELLTNITIYWVTGTINASTRMYYESMGEGRASAIDGRIEVPTAIAVFPGELYRPPRAWCEQLYNVAQWTKMPSGGHFAAMEEPALLVDDVRTFFRRFR
jgi:pimeloyl-ACP methyl ester carboxylesterase